MYLENNQIHRYPIRAIIAWFLVILWMAVIFLLSHQTGDQSSQLSLRIAEFLLNLVAPGYSPNHLNSVENLIRILAHGASFFILAILTGRAFTRTSIQDIRNAILTFIICALYAASDELHQAFVPGRAGQWQDFLVDIAGIILAITIYQLITSIRFIRSELRVKREEDLRK